MTDNSQTPSAPPTEGSWLVNLRISWLYMTLIQKWAVVCVIVCLTVSALLDLLLITSVFPIIASFLGSDSSISTNDIEEGLETRIFHRILNPELAMLVVSHRSSTLALCDRIEEMPKFQNSFDDSENIVSNVVHYSPID